MEEKVIHRGQEALHKEVLNPGLCTGCGACVGLCPYLIAYRGKTAVLFPCVTDEGRCFAYCPKIGVDFDDLSCRLFGSPRDENPIGTCRSILAARAGDRIKGLSPQAGGTVSALLYLALGKGYLDGAVLTDRQGLLPVPRLITAPEDVLDCATAKYTAAPTLSAVNQAIREGRGNLGVVGTPCQVLATALMRQNPLQTENVADPFGLVVGIFCTWAIDFRRFEPFLAARIDPARIRKIDIPPPPAEIMEVYVDNGTRIEIPLQQIRELVLKGCSYCTDMTAEFSDLSVGVMEGRPDMNTLIIRTDRGRALVEEAQKEGYLTVSAMPDEQRQHLVWAAGNKKRRALANVKEAGMVDPETDPVKSCPGKEDQLVGQPTA